jgi:hypothetical protein
MVVLPEDSFVSTCSVVAVTVVEFRDCRDFHF